MRGVRVFFHAESKQRFIIGGQKCFECQCQINDFLILKEHYYKDKPGLIIFNCLDCSKKKSKNYLPGDIKTPSYVIIINNITELPQGSKPMLLIPPGVTQVKGLSTFQAALLQESGVQVNDKTVWSGRNQSEHLDYEPTKLLERLEQLDKPLLLCEADDYLLKLANSTPIIEHKTKPMVTQQ